MKIWLSILLAIVIGISGALILGGILDRERAATSKIADECARHQAVAVLSYDGRQIVCVEAK